MIPGTVSLTPFFVICGLVCLFWLLVHCFMASRLDTFKLVILMLFIVFLTAGGDVMLGSLTGSDAVSHLVILISAPAIIPLSCIYFAHLSTPFHSKPEHFFWVVIPIALFTAALLITLLKGVPETDLLLEKIHSGYHLGLDITLEGLDRVYYILTVVVFRGLMALETVIMLVYCGILIKRHHLKPSYWWGFLFKGRKISVLQVQMTLSLFILAGFSVKVFLHVPFYRLHPVVTLWVVAIISLLLFFFGMFALFGTKEFITEEEVGSALRYNFSRENKALVTEEMVLDMLDDLSGDSLTHVISRISMNKDALSDPFSVRRAGAPSLSAALFGNAKNWDEGSLVTRFQHLMQDEELFLQPGLTLGDVALRLDSNKTYISKMVNQTYGVGFPELLNIMRVDYAELYIRKNKNASQEEIAKASGFLSASSFNSTFKRITGYTPKVWASRKA